MRKLILFSFLICGALGFSQTTIKGKVVDQDDQPVPSANVVIVGKAEGTVADFDGNFVLTTSETPPFKLKITSIGYAEAVIDVIANNQNLTVKLEETTSILDEVVISASRTPERIFESPVTVERFGLKEIKNTASADFYDGLENLKGVDINTNSLTFKSINTRGFASFGNNRFMQLVDGMDNSAPALNFPLGNLVGMIETDVLSVELLPGAASALYGANAFNGILFMRSKSPFDFTGLSGYVKRGITSQKEAGDNPYTDFGIRAAHKFSDKFAGKVNFGVLTGTDWFATNYDDKNMSGGSRETNLDYDGVNVYGDNARANIKDVALALESMSILPAGANALVPSAFVSRTGYAERDLTDYKAESVKADWGLYYRPWENDFEIAYVGKVGTGSTIYQGAQRYAIDDFSMQQHKMEIKNDNFFIRGYINSDDAGNSYVMDVAGPNLLAAWKPHSTWFGEYTGAYVQATLGGATDAQAHAVARQTAETGRLEPGTPEFQNAFDAVTSDTSFLTGSKFRDNSKIYHADANYNFSHLTDFAEIQVGGSYRTYKLNSYGTIYTDAESSIPYSEIGMYTQIQKTVLEKLKLTGSLRYDKSELFDGFFSPRISAGYTIGEEGNHNIRASYQTGFRNPNTQDLYIGLETALGTLIGGADDNGDRYVRDYGISQFAQNNLGQPASVSQAASAAYNNSMAASIATGLASHNPANNGSEFIGNPDDIKPEQVTSFEVGYRGKIKKLIVDFSAYYNTYNDFIANESVVSTYYGNVSNFDLTGYDPQNPASAAGLNQDTRLILSALQNNDYAKYQTYTNASAEVNSYGGAIAVTTKVLGNFDLGANYTFSDFNFDKEANPDFRPSFNTPMHKVKATFGNVDLFNNFGFNVAWRWSDVYLWESSFGDGVVPSYHVVDAQISYRVPSLKSSFKLGATNLLGDEYASAFGTGNIGSMYYLSWTINNL